MAAATAAIGEHASAAENTLRWVHRITPSSGFFFVFQKWLRAQRVGRVAPLGGGAKRRAAALGAAQRPKAPPQAAERRAAHEARFPAFYFAPIIEKEKMLTQKSVRNRQILRLGQSFGTIWHGQHLKYLRSHKKLSRKLRGCGEKIALKVPCISIVPTMLCITRRDAKCNAGQQELALL